jgi:hypothetical protein
MPDMDQHAVRAKEQQQPHTPPVSCIAVPHSLSCVAGPQVDACWPRVCMLQRPRSRISQSTLSILCMVRTTSAAAKVYHALDPALPCDRAQAGNFCGHAVRNSCSARSPVIDMCGLFTQFGQLGGKSSSKVVLCHAESTILCSRRSGI